MWEPKFVGEIMFRNWMRVMSDAVMLGLETQAFYV